MTLTWDEIHENVRPLHDIRVGSYRIAIHEDNALGFPRTRAAFFRKDLILPNGQWRFCGSTEFALPCHLTEPDEPRIVDVP